MSFTSFSSPDDPETSLLHHEHRNKTTSRTSLTGPETVRTTFDQSVIDVTRSIEHFRDQLSKCGKSVDTVGTNRDSVTLREKLCENGKHGKVCRVKGLEVCGSLAKEIFGKIEALAVGEEKGKVWGW